MGLVAGPARAALHATPSPGGNPHGSAPEYAGKLDLRNLHEDAGATRDLAAEARFSLECL